MYGLKGHEAHETGFLLSSLGGRFLKYSLRLKQISSVAGHDGTYMDVISLKQQPPVYSKR